MPNMVTNGGREAIFVVYNNAGWWKRIAHWRGWSGLPLVPNILPTWSLLSKQTLFWTFCLVIHRVILTWLCTVFLPAFGMPWSRLCCIFPQAGLKNNNDSFLFFGCFRMIHYWLKQGIRTHESLFLTKAKDTRNYCSAIEGWRKPTCLGEFNDVFARAAQGLETYFSMANLEKLRGIIFVYNLHLRPKALHFSSQKSLSESMWYTIYKEKLQ